MPKLGLVRLVEAHFFFFAQPSHITLCTRDYRSRRDLCSIKMGSHLNFIILIYIWRITFIWVVDINSDKELFIAHTQERMKNLVGESGNRTHDFRICTPVLYRLSYLDNLMTFYIVPEAIQESVQSHPKLFKVTPLFKVTLVYGTCVNNYWCSLSILYGLHILDQYIICWYLHLFAINNFQETVICDW